MLGLQTWLSRPLKQLRIRANNSRECETALRAIDDMCRDKVDDDVIRNVERIIELVMIRDNMLQLSSNVF